MLHVPCMKRGGRKSGWLPLQTESGLVGDRGVRLELVQVESLSCFYIAFNSGYSHCAN
jgi:hypothetical protein